FGLATIYPGSVTDPNVLEYNLRYGTNAYFSPQKANQSQPYNPYAADVWSFGVLAMEVLQGPMRYWKLPPQDKSSSPSADPNYELYRIIDCVLVQDEANRWRMEQFLERLKMISFEN